MFQRWGDVQLATLRTAPTRPRVENLVYPDQLTSRWRSSRQDRPRCCSDIWTCSLPLLKSPGIHVRFKHNGLVVFQDVERRLADAECHSIGVAPGGVTDGGHPVW